MTGLLYMNVRLLEDKILYDKAMSLISDKRRAYIRGLKNPSVAGLSLSAGILLRLAMEKGGYSMENIKYTAYGKPYLENTDFYFNLSHSGEYAVCVYSDVPVGIDLQKIKADIPRYTAKILTKEEEQFLQSLPDVKKIDAFFRIWTKKESLVKWDGRGLRIPLQTISVAKANGFCDKTTFEDKEIYWKELYFLMPEYALCMCFEKNIIIDEIVEVTSEFLTKY